MKKFYFLFVILIIMTPLLGASQVTKLKSTSLALKTKNEATGRWTEWQDQGSTEVLITMNLPDDRIKVFSKVEQVYDIIKYYEKTTDSDGDDTIKFQCVDQNGLKCIVRFVLLNSKNGQRQLYVDYSDMIWVYNIYVLD